MIRSSSVGNHSQAVRQISSTVRDPSNATKFLTTGRGGAHAILIATAGTEVEKEAARMPRHVRTILRSSTSLAHRQSAQKWKQQRQQRHRQRQVPLQHRQRQKNKP